MNIYLSCNFSFLLTLNKLSSGLVLRDLIMIEEGSESTADADSETLYNLPKFERMNDVIANFKTAQGIHRDIPKIKPLITMLKSLPAYDMEAFLSLGL